MSLFSFFRPSSREKKEGRPHPPAQVGKNSFVHSRVQVIGWSQVFIGNDCMISEDCWFNINHRPHPDCRIEIGDHSFIGRRNFITAGGIVALGPYCLTGPDCHFLGADHEFVSPFVPYIAAPVTHGGDIRLGANCWLGASVTVLKGVNIGYGCVIGAGAIVTRHVPPFSIVIGSPARITKRYHPLLKAWIPGAELPPEVEAALPDELTYSRGLSVPWTIGKGLSIISGSDQGDLS